MDKIRTTTIIENTFKHHLEENRFYKFYKNILNDLDESYRFDYISREQTKNFKPHITKYKLLGTYEV